MTDCIRVFVSRQARALGWIALCMCGVVVQAQTLKPSPNRAATDALSLRAGDSPKAHSGQAGAILRIVMDSNSDRSNRKVEVKIHWTALAVAAAAAIVGFLV